MRMKKSTRVKSAPRAKKSTSGTGAIGTQAMFLVAVGVVAAATMLFAGHQSSSPSRSAAVDAPQEKVARATATKAGASVAPALDTMRAANVTDIGLPPEESTANATRPRAAVVTITGCLERSRETFRLKDTTGLEAQTSRSWKSGFLKKGRASIEVVDAANRLRLPNHVGERVSVTGTIVDREMQVRSLKRLAASCAGQIAKL